MSEAPGRNTREYARQLQEKFELYLLGLIFTLLALAVQTAKFGAAPCADGLEVAGWVSLLISGLVGLSRMEGVPSPTRCTQRKWTWRPNGTASVWQPTRARAW